MRIYVESSVKKNLTFLSSKISKKVKEQNGLAQFSLGKKDLNLFKSEMPPPPPLQCLGGGSSCEE
jgi:hypothetical protein